MKTLGVFKAEKCGTSFLFVFDDLRSLVMAIHLCITHWLLKIGVFNSLLERCHITKAE